MTNLASIDIGSHTTRLLIVKKDDYSSSFYPIHRERAYTNLAENYDGRIKEDAINNTIHVLNKYLSIIKKNDVKSIIAVSTGVVREAENGDYLIQRINQKTGIDVKAISGEEEADLTSIAVIEALGLEKEPFLIFDLGGGSTEFIIGSFFDQKIKRIFKSINLGVMLLKNKYVFSDPPSEKQIDAIESYVNGVLEKEFLEKINPNKNNTFVGTGGTITTLAAMLKKIPVDDISPENLNGFRIEQNSLNNLYQSIKKKSLYERSKMPGLDKNRADVIIIGTAIISRIIDFFGFKAITVCLSDLLEGNILKYSQ